MRNLYQYIFILLVVVTAVGCQKDLLDKSPLDKLSTETFYKDQSQADMALNGVYNSFNCCWLMLDFMSDNNYCQDAWQGSLEFSQWTQNSSSWRAWEKWAIGYQTIGRVNRFLENIVQVPISDDVKNRMMAEARFMRAYWYADLVHFFGDVPLILKTLTLSESQVTRTPKADVLKAAEADFDFAIANLPVKASEVGRATKGAAWAFKARMYLYNERWAEAAAAANEVIKLNTYSLQADYQNIFVESNENNSEVIFDIQYIRNTRQQPWPSTALSYSEWPTAGVTLSMIDSYYMKNGKAISDAGSGYNEQDPFKDRDPRMAATFFLPGSQFKGKTFIPKGESSRTCFRPRKYADENNPDLNNCGLNLILMRYADVLLMRAEALIETGNTTQEVYDLINQVRQRASVNMPKIEAAEGTGLSQAQLRQILRHERRVEFPMEFTRYSDMRRWKLESAVQDVYGFNKEALSDPSDPAKWVFKREKLATRSFDPKKGWLWPIPQDDINSNKNMKQNDGY